MYISGYYFYLWCVYNGGDVSLFSRGGFTYYVPNLREHYRYYSFANVDPFLQDNLTSQCKEMMAALKDDLSCPVCLEQLTSPVVQCNNGHNTCSKCIKLNCRECPLCRARFFTSSLTTPALPLRWCRLPRQSLGQSPSSLLCLQAH